MAKPLELSDTIKAALNGYKEGVMSRTEAILLLSEAFIQKCKTCPKARTPAKEPEPDTTW